MAKASGQYMPPLTAAAVHSRPVGAGTWSRDRARQMASGNPLRVGLAGLGRFGKLHAAVLSRLPGVELAAICDPNEEETAAARERFGVDAAFADFAAMLEASPLDAVFIVTPEPLHAGQAMRAIGRGVAVFVEKPLAMSAEEGASHAHPRLAMGLRVEAKAGQLRAISLESACHLSVEAARDV